MKTEIIELRRVVMQILGRYPQFAETEFGKSFLEQISEGDTAITGIVGKINFKHQDCSWKAIIGLAEKTEFYINESKLDNYSVIGIGSVELQDSEELQVLETIEAQLKFVEIFVTKSFKIVIENITKFCPNM